jgi:hypothetical protein
MSKLAKVLQDAVTGNVRASRSPTNNYMDVSLHVKADPHHLSKEYLLKATFEAKAWLDDSDVNGRIGITYSLKRSILEEVFGEFRPYLIELRTALYDQDLNRAQTLLAEFEHQMFQEGLR